MPRQKKSEAHSAIHPAAMLMVRDRLVLLAEAF